MGCWNRRGGNQKRPRERACGPSSADANSRVGRAGRSGLRGVRGQVFAPYCAFKSSVVDVAGSRDQFARSVTVRGKFVFVGVVVSRVFQRVGRRVGDGGLGRVGVVGFCGVLGSVAGTQSSVGLEVVSVSVGHSVVSSVVMQADRIGYSVVSRALSAISVRRDVMRAVIVSASGIMHSRGLIVNAARVSNGIMRSLASHAVRIRLTAMRNLTAMSSPVPSAGSVALNSTLVDGSKLNFHDTNINESGLNEATISDNVADRITTRAVHIDVQAIRVTRVSAARGSKLTARASFACEGSLATNVSLARDQVSARCASTQTALTRPITSQQRNGSVNDTRASALAINPQRAGIRQLQLQVVVPHRLELRQRRQLIEASQAEVIEKFAGGTE